MASRSGPRSASDATRFTSTTPQPKSKASAAKGGPVGETLEQRVQRLRAAHLAARNAPLSTYDRVTAGGRRVFDVMHKVTLAGLIGFTVIAGVFSVYAVMDMVKYNRKRREDFIQAQKKIEQDTLSSARLAFLNGTANEEQIRLVEETLREAERTGAKLPPLLSGPSSPQAAQKDASIWDQVDAQVKAQGGTVQAVANAKTEEMRRKVKDAFEKERENQKVGGPLDQLASGTSSPPTPATKGSKWWPW